MPQKVMYPKDLVYPSKTEEYQLEMIRARHQLYQCRLAAYHDTNDSDDMEMTVALDGKITLNIPAVNLMESKKHVKPSKKIKRTG